MSSQLLFVIIVLIIYFAFFIKYTSIVKAFRKYLIEEFNLNMTKISNERFEKVSLDEIEKNKLGKKFQLSAIIILLIVFIAAPVFYLLSPNLLVGSLLALGLATLLAIFDYIFQFSNVTKGYYVFYNKHLVFKYLLIKKEKDKLQKAFLISIFMGIVLSLLEIIISSYLIIKIFYS